MVKRIFASLVIVIALLQVNVFAAEFPKPTEEFFVNDTALVIDEDVKTHIVNTSNELEKLCGAQIVVVTVDTIGNESLEKYSLELARSWGIGSSEKNNGLLLLVSVDDKLSRVEVGRGLEGILPDGKTGRFQDEYMLPLFKQGDYSTGIKNIYDAFVTEVCNEYNVEIPANVTPEVQEDEENFGIIKLGFMIIAFIIFIILFNKFPFLFIGLRGGRGGKGGGSTGGGGGFGGGGSSRGW